MILHRIRSSNIDPNVKEFLIEILQFEIANPKEMSPRYKEEYLKMIQKHMQSGKELHKS